MIRNSKTITTTFFSTLDKEQTKDCLKFLLLPWRWKDWKRGKYIKEAENKIKEFIGGKEVFSFYNGRAALYYALKTVGVKNGDEVIIQAYTCVTVPNAVLALGAKPIYCDVDESLNLDPRELVKKITDKTKAVIAQHTFGNPARIEEIREVCERRKSYLKGEGDAGKIFLIEDCAHSLGARYNGKLAGAFGDIAMFSFGRDKVISSIAGGMICVNNEKLLNNAAGGRDAINRVSTTDMVDNISYPSFLLIAKNLLYPIIAQISLKWYNKGNIGKGIMYLSKKLKLFPLILTKEEKNGYASFFEKGGEGMFFYKMPNVLAYLFLRQFKKLEKCNEHRYRIANFYNEALVGSEFKFPKIWDESEPIYLRYTVFTDKAMEIMRSAKKNDIYLGDWYRQVIAPRGVDLKAILYEQNMCSLAEKYAAMTLNLPNHTGINFDDARTVVREIKN